MSQARTPTNAPISSSSISRREFVSRAALATAGLALPLILPSRLRGANAPSNRLRLGQIGCGRIARVHDMPAIVKANLGDYVAVCDLDEKRVNDARVLLKELTASQTSPAPEVRGYRDYHELFARPDIDAVVISTPDHWHADLAVAAILAGKD